MAVLTVEISEELHERLQKLAADMGQTLEQCQIWALEDFVGAERPLTDAFLRGVQDADEGRLSEHERVMTWARLWSRPIALL